MYFVVVKPKGGKGLGKGGAKRVVKPKGGKGLGKGGAMRVVKPKGGKGLGKGGAWRVANIRDDSGNFLQYCVFEFVFFLKFLHGIIHCR